MSQKNAETVRRAAMAATAQPADSETLNELFHPDHVLTRDWGVESRSYRGAAGLR
jgi:hypothetical protein